MVSRKMLIVVARFETFFGQQSKEPVFWSYFENFWWSLILFQRIWLISGVWWIKMIRVLLILSKSFHHHKSLRTAWKTTTSVLILKSNLSSLNPLHEFFSIKLVLQQQKLMYSLKEKYSVPSEWHHLDRPFVLTALTCSQIEWNWSN